MKEKLTALNTGLHVNEPEHERWRWFSEPGIDPPSNAIQSVRKVIYQDYSHAVYDEHLQFIGNVPEGNIDLSKQAAKTAGRAVIFLKLPDKLPEPSPDESQRRSQNWNPAWGENPEEEE